MAGVTKKEETSLTANIFFIFLVDSMKNKAIQFERCKENTLTQTHIYYDLCILSQDLYTDLGEYDELLSGGKLKQQYCNLSSNFRNGGLSIGKSRYFPFNSDDVIFTFDNQIKNDYSSVYHKTVQFAQRYFDDSDSSRNIFLIQKLLYYIINDESIDDAQEFYINSNGSPIAKSKLKNISEIEFEAFILGIWHYLITSQRLQANVNSVPTIVDKLLKKSFNIKLVFKNEADNIYRGNNADKNDTRFKSEKAKRIVKRPRKSIKHSFVPDDDPSIDFDFYPSEIDYNTDIISVLENNDIRLSRGIFFYLMTQSIQTVHPKRNKNVVESLFLDMLNLTADNSCNIDLSQSHVRDHHDKFRYLKALCSADCLDDAASVNAFSDRLHTDYDEFLSDIIKIRKKYFKSSDKNEVLVVALIEFIRNDDSIDECQEFLICSDGTAVTKTQLCEVEEIEFESFLLGVWHYVVSQLDYKDSADEYTFDTVFKVSYKYNGKDCTRYRSGDLIEEQSELYVELTYLEE